MTPHRDPEGRLPDGSGFAICAMLALVFWAVLGFWWIASPSHPSISTEELRHAAE